MIRTPIALLFLSLASAGTAWFTGTGKPDLWLDVSVLCAVAALLLLVRAVIRGPNDTAFQRLSRQDDDPRPKKAKRPVVIDGSNIMYWEGESPKLETVQRVIQTLKGRGFQPGIVFDANAGYLLADRYLDDRHFAKMLRLPASRVLVVPKGEPADPTILAAARDLGAKVISNDQFRDWVTDFPEISEDGRLVRGGFQDRTLWFDDRALEA